MINLLLPQKYERYLENIHQTDTVMCFNFPVTLIFCVQRVFFLRPRGRNLLEGFQKP